MTTKRVTWAQVRKQCKNGFYVSTSDFYEGYVLRENNGGIVATTPKQALIVIETWK